MKDAWDQEPEPEPEKPAKGPTKDKFKGKAGAASGLKVSDRFLTAEEQAAERERLQQLQINSDLGVAAETFGISDFSILDRSHPVTKPEFDEFKKALLDKFDSVKVIS